MSPLPKGWPNTDLGFNPKSSDKNVKIFFIFA